MIESPAIEVSDIQFVTLPSSDRPSEPTRLDIFSRVEGFEKIDPDHLSSITQYPLDLLATNEDTPEVVAKAYLEACGGDRTKALLQLTDILGNCDLVDILTTVDPQDGGWKNPALIAYVKGWKQWMIDHFHNPEFHVPQDIRTDDDLAAYLQFFTPIRLSQISNAKIFYENFNHVTEISGTGAANLYFRSERRLLSSQTQASNAIMLNAVRAAVELVQDPAEKNQLIQTMASAIESQAKWWIMGEDEDDPLTSALIDQLRGLGGAQAADVILKACFTKTKQDTLVLHHPPLYPEEPLLKVDPFRDGYLKPALQAGRQHVDRLLIEEVQKDTPTGDLSVQLLQDDILHHQTFELDDSHHAVIYDKTVEFSGLPAGQAVIIRELSNNIFAALDQDGNTLGLYDFRAHAYLRATDLVIVSAVTPESVMQLFHNQSANISPEEIRNFVSDFEQYRVRYHLNGSDLLPEIYQLWKYRKDLKGPDAGNFDTFMDTYPVRAVVHSFLSGEFGRKNIQRVISFIKTGKAEVYQDDEGIDHVRTYNTDQEKIIEIYSHFVDLSEHIAGEFSPIPEQAHIIQNIILDRAKALLLSAISMQEKHGSLTNSDMWFIDNGLHMYNDFLHALADPASETIQMFHVPYPDVLEFMRLHDPRDPDSRALFDTTMNTWFEASMARQRDAPYVGHTEEITTAFYAAYEELERDSSNTTGDTEKEVARYIQSIDHDIDAGLLTSQDGKPVVIGFLGIGNSRAELPLINHYKARGLAARFIGIDINRPRTIPEDVEFQRMNMLALGKEMPGKFDKLDAIWSPFMDVIELSEIETLAESLSHALKDGAVLELDVAFPFGAHSYEKPVSDFHGEHPEEPYGMMYRDFPRDGKPPIGKRFFASDPALIHYVFAKHGLTFENLPNDLSQLAEMCTRASKDDSFITEGDQTDLDNHPLYRTASGYNRITYKLRKAYSIPASIDLGSMVRQYRQA